MRKRYRVHIAYVAVKFMIVAPLDQSALDWSWVTLADFAIGMNWRESNLVYDQIHFTCEDFAILDFQNCGVQAPIVYRTLLLCTYTFNDIPIVFKNTRVVYCIQEVLIWISLFYGKILMEYYYKQALF